MMYLFSPEWQLARAKEQISTLRELRLHDAQAKAEPPKRPPVRDDACQALTSLAEAHAQIATALAQALIDGG